MNRVYIGLGLSQFLACFCGLGTVYTFGCWVPTLLEEFGGSNAHTQVILGLLQSGFFLGGVPARPLLRRWGYRALYLAGGATTSGVLFLISFAHQLWVVYLVFFAALGMQASWMASGALIPQHMPPKEAARYGAWAVTGSGVGTVVLASAARAMLPVIGWRGGLRVLAAAFAGLYALGAVWQRAPEPPPKAAGVREEVEAGYRWLLRDARCHLMFAAMGLSAFGYMLPFAVQGAHAIRNGVSLDDVSTIYMMFGFFSMLGRVLAGIIGAHVDPMHVWTVSMYLIAVCVALIAFARDTVAFAIANALLGICSGPMIALLVPALRELVGVARIPEALALGMLVEGLCTLPAPALAGWLADSSGSYFLGILIGALGVLGGAVLVSLVLVLGPRPAEDGLDCTEAGAATSSKGPQQACQSLEDPGQPCREAPAVGQRWPPAGAPRKDAVHASGPMRTNAFSMAALMLCGGVCRQ